MGATEDFNNPNLFADNPAGVYTYSSDAYGKSARGQLQNCDNPARDAQAQRSAGGADRRGKESTYGVDDGGHLIGARFGGAPGSENLTPQDRNLNRGAYNTMEKEWAERISNGDKVFVNVESYTGDGSDRPTNYMGYVITEHTDDKGVTTRYIEYISINNESRMEQEKWEEELDEFYRENPDFAEELREMKEETPAEEETEEETEEVTAENITDGQDMSDDDQSQEAEGDQDYGDESLEDDTAADYGAEDAEYEAESSDYGAEEGEYEAEDADYGAEDAAYDADAADYGNEFADYGADSADYGTDSADYGADSADYGTDSADYGADSADYSADSSVEHGSDSGGGADSGQDMD